MLNNIGNLALSRGDLEEARTYFEQALTLYESMKAPVDMGRTLHNLAVTFANAGDYEGATRRYVRALELRRQGDDRRGTAIESYSLGVLFEYQGQFGNALDAHSAAVTTLREIHENGFWLAAILGQQGSALNQTGRFKDAQPLLNEALSVAKSLHHAALTAQILGFQGDGFYLQGDTAHARALYESALQTFGSTPDRRIALQLKVDLARPGVSSQPAESALATLRTLVTEADVIGYKHLAVECAVNLGDMLLRAGRVADARQELEHALSRSDRFGLRLLSARSHWLLADVEERSRHANEARRHRDEARQLIEQIKKDARTDAVTQRADLASIVHQ
jgi:eukaryotic-like serine/threonine-protein kinase